MTIWIHGTRLFHTPTSHNNAFVRHYQQVTDRDEAGLRQVLLEYNVTKNANKTKKWLVKQLNKICDKDRGAPLDLAPSLGLPPTMGMPPVPYHYQHLPSSM